jgi:hypothetical protein
MLKAMKLSGLKMKKIEISNVPAKREARVQEFRDKIINLDL